MQISSIKYGYFRGLVENKVKNFHTEYVPPDVFLKYTNLCVKKLHSLTGMKDFEDYFTSAPLTLSGNTYTITFLKNIDRIKTAISETLGEFKYYPPTKFYDCKNNPHFERELFFTREGDKLYFHKMISDPYGDMSLKYYRLPFDVTLDEDFLDFKDDNIDSLLDFVTYKVLLDQKGQVPQSLYNSVNELLQEKNATIEEKPKKVKNEMQSE